MSTITTELQEMLSNLKQELVSAVNKKVYKTELGRLLIQSQEALDQKLESKLAEKVNVHDVEGLCTHTIESCTKALADLQADVLEELDTIRLSSASTFVPKVHWEDWSSNWTLELEQVKKQLLLKVGIKDACTLLDAKCSVMDVNLAVETLEATLETTCVKQEDFHALVSDMSCFQKQMRSEVCHGRWIWKTGRPQSTQTIVWNVQAVNTAPDVFVWEPHADVITAVRVFRI